MARMRRVRVSDSDKDKAWRKVQNVLDNADAEVISNPETAYRVLEVIYEKERPHTYTIVLSRPFDLTESKPWWKFW